MPQSPRARWRRTGPGTTACYLISTPTWKMYQPRRCASLIPGRRHDDYYDGRNKIFLQKGWTHVEVKVASLKGGALQRNLSLDRIRRFELSFDGMRLPATIYLDNLRLVSGEEGPESASKFAPQDTVSVIDNRWVSVRQVALSEDVPEASDVTRLRAEADRESELLKNTIQAAQTQGIETIYAERHLITADLALRVRPLLAWYNNDEKKARDVLLRSRGRAGPRVMNWRTNCAGRTCGKRWTTRRWKARRSSRFLLSRAVPAKGWFFRDQHGEPMMILSLHSP